MDAFLVNVSSAYSVKWSPEPRRQDMQVSIFASLLARKLIGSYSLDQLSEILDSASSPVVDLVQLRKLCSRGVWSWT